METNVEKNWLTIHNQHDRIAIKVMDDEGYYALSGSILPELDEIIRH